MRARVYYVCVRARARIRRTEARAFVQTDLARGQCLQEETLRAE